MVHGATSITILGPVAIVTENGPPRTLPRQLRRVLAVLAVSREAPLSADRIVRRVWEGEAPDSAIQMVRNQIRMLRRLAGDVVERGHSGYRLRLPTDADRFRALVREGRHRHAEGASAQAVVVTSQALALWRGPEALADVRDVADLQVAAIGLDELRFQAEELLADAHLSCGRPQDALPIVHAMTIRHPARELPWLQLMAAQASIGRRAEASTDTYRLARHHLVERTGLDAPRLARLHQALLRGAADVELVALTTRGNAGRPSVM
jgi:DNA-binding SARP family transcriptional activator